MSTGDPVRQRLNMEAEQLLGSKIDKLFAGIDACLSLGLWEPTLILVYSGIDAMAWLDRPDGQADVTSTDFCAWSNNYLLAPNQVLTSEDLYGARCGLLHSHTGESRKHRELKIKKVFYHRKQGDDEYAIIQLGMNEKFLPPTVDLDALVRVFKVAVENFRADFVADATRRDRIYDRILGSYMAEVRMVR